MVKEISEVRDSTRSAPANPTNTTYQIVIPPLPRWNGSQWVSDPGHPPATVSVTQTASTDPNTAPSTQIIINIPGIAPQSAPVSAKLPIHQSDRIQDHPHSSDVRGPVSSQEVNSRTRTSPPVQPVSRETPNTEPSTSVSIASSKKKSDASTRQDDANASDVNNVHVTSDIEFSTDEESDLSEKSLPEKDSHGDIPRPVSSTSKLPISSSNNLPIRSLERESSPPVTRFSLRSSSSTTAPPRIPPAVKPVNLASSERSRKRLREHSSTTHQAVDSGKRHTGTTPPASQTKEERLDKRRHGETETEFYKRIRNTCPCINLLTGEEVHRDDEIDFDLGEVNTPDDGDRLYWKKIVPSAFRKR